MNTSIVDNRLSCFKKQFPVWFPSFLVILFLSYHSHAQQGSLACNAITPLVPPTFTITETHDESGLLTFWTNPGNVINANTSDFAVGTLALGGTLQYRVTDADQEYAAGNFAGFLLEGGPLSTGLFSGVTIRTYLDGALRQTYSAIDLLTLDLGLFNDPFQVGFITSQSFDAVELTLTASIVFVGSINVYYVSLEKFCAGPSLTCNVETQMNAPLFPVTIDYANTGSGGASVGTVDDPENAISASTTDYASLINVASVLGSTFLTVEEQVIDYPSGTFVGFEIENLNLLGADVLNFMTITSYLNGVQKQVVSGPALLAGVPLLSSDGRHTVGIVTNTAVDKVKITVAQPAGVTLGTTRVYGAIFRKLCAGPPLDCNELTSITIPDYPVLIDVGNTGLSGVACGGCNVFESGNVIDANTSNYARITLTGAAATTGSIAVKEQLTDYPANTFAGFRIKKANLADADVLTGITVKTYLEGVEQESHTNIDGLVSVSTDLLLADDEQVVGFVTDLPFDEVKVSVIAVGSVNVGTTRVYELLLTGFCPAEIVCDTIYFLNSPEFPVYIDAFLTGPDAVACALCEVVDEQNVITASNTDYATITVVANAAGATSLAVADALYTYPAGTRAGFVIHDLGLLLQANLFQTLTVSTYLDGQLQEFRTGGSLLELDLLILFINPGSGIHNVGFEATMPFDEVRISVGSLVGVPNIIRVYSAFIDTRASSGGTLLCNDPPVAVDDAITTDENMPVIIPVCDNDDDTDDPVVGPMVIEPPAHGDTQVNPDNTITYSPDENFVGQDTFTYEICDPDNLCDTARVVVTVVPERDTIIMVIPEDSTFTVCANELTTFTVPATSISICDTPAHGNAQVTADCMTYDPTANFFGLDTMCVYTCHPNDPTLCDTTIIFIQVTPVDDSPIAADDVNFTNEDTPVNGTAQTNDTPSGDGGNTWSLVGMNGGAANGMVMMNADGSYSYTPDPGFNGMDQFTYQLCDTDNDCDQATVVITVGPVDDQPIAQDDTNSTNEDTPVMGTVTANDTPSDDGGNVWSLVTDALNGMVILNPDGTYTYTPDPNFNGMDQFTYQVCDTDNDCDQATVTITVGPIDDQPIAEDDSETTPEDTPIVSTVVTNDTPSGDGGNTWSLNGINGGALHGDVVMNPDGSYTYTPDLDYFGPDQFSYQVCDIDNDCDIAVVNITVENVLPLVLVNFEVTTNESTVILDWMTSFESNLDYFEVQKAGEDKQFAAIGEVRGAGNSSSVKSYRFTDFSPFSGKNYYRLHSVDYDGAESLSPIRSVQFGTRAPLFMVMPNPASKEVYITSNDANRGNIEVKMINMEGRILRNEKIKANTYKLTFSVSDLDPGMYDIMITGQGFIEHQKLIKVK